MVQDILRQDAKIQDLYFNISVMMLSITSLYIISDAPKYDITWTENSDVIDSFISEILKYKSTKDPGPYITTLLSKTLLYWKMEQLYIAELFVLF